MSGVLIRHIIIMCVLAELSLLGRVSALEDSVSVSASVPATSYNTPPLPSFSPHQGVTLSPAAAMDSVVFRGFAYPLSMVTLLVNGSVVAEGPANIDGTFHLSLRNVASGVYTYSLRATDSYGLSSGLTSVTVLINSLMTTSIDNILLSPTLTADKVSALFGSPVTLFGKATPMTNLYLEVDDSAHLSKLLRSGADGTWRFDYDTRELGIGYHVVSVRQYVRDDTSPLSLLYTVEVGNKNVFNATTSLAFLSPYRRKCDVNADSRVNLLDFSIMAFWYERNFPPDRVDMNGDSSVDLADFSILAYCWTG